MVDRFQRRALALLKVPPEPHPPAGDPASLRVFRAGQNYFRLRMAGWAVAQVLALAVIIFWTVTLVQVERMVRAQGSNTAPPPVAPESISTPAPADSPNATTRRSRSNQRSENWAERFAKTVTTAAERAKSTVEEGERTGGIGVWVDGYQQFLVEFALLLPVGAFSVIWALKILGIVVYVFQLPITYVVRRLDYELRWYMVTDRSLRLRHGVWRVSESTMSFANLQQVEVVQGPVQRLLGLADVKVQSAGGGSSGTPHHSGENMHLGLFHSVTNAAEIRDLILERLRRFRETGLGDPDETARAANPPTQTVPLNPVVAARELVAEIRALRDALP